jgi:hypothetical protein
MGVMTAAAFMQLAFGWIVGAFAQSAGAPPEHAIAPHSRSRPPPRCWRSSSMPRSAMCGREADGAGRSEH